MGNINCIHRRRSISDCFRSRVNICRNPKRSQSDGSLGSLGNNTFEDEIVDPVEASLIANGIEDISLETRDVIDVMVAFRRVPWVKAIARIQADDASFKWRKDPIPEVERRGSINDLTERREMRKREKMEEETTRVDGKTVTTMNMNTAIDVQQKIYIPDVNRRSNNNRLTEEIGEEIEEKEKMSVTPRKQHQIHNFMASSYNAFGKKTIRKEGAGLIRRYSSVSNLPPVD